MTPYTVLSTGCNEGLVETVLNAQTIAKIQQESSKVRAAGAWNEKCIYQYLHDKFSGDEER